MNRDEFWVFGYASLMWRPGFSYVEARPGRLEGYHRALCVYSVEHRGTVARPGLVFGLDRGGACDGTAFRVAPENVDTVLAYLREREQVTGVYLERRRPISLLATAGGRESATVGAKPGEAVRATCYVVDAQHRQYTGRLALAREARIVCQAIGKAGPNLDYVLSTAMRIGADGIRDRRLERLVALIGPRALPVLERLRQGDRAEPRLITARLRQSRQHRVVGRMARARADLEMNHRKNLGY